MQAVEGVDEIHLPGLAILASRLDGEVAGAHGGLAHVVDAVEEVGLVVLGLGHVGGFGQDGGKDLAHYVLVRSIR